MNFILRDFWPMFHRQIPQEKMFIVSLHSGISAGKYKIKLLEPKTIHGDKNNKRRKFTTIPHRDHLIKWFLFRLRFHNRNIVTQWPLQQKLTIRKIKTKSK